MNIENEIRQQVFKNPYHKLAVNLMFTHSWLMSFVKAMFKKQDITPNQYNILRILRGSRPNPLSTLQIRERMLDKMSDTSRLVDRLLLKDLVSKKINQTDNRLVDVENTEKGLKVLEKLDDIEERVASLFENLSEKEALRLSDMLDKLHTNKAPSANASNF